MKKILFIIQSYPSEKSANVLCDERVMKELISSGNFEVHCLCYKYANQLKEEIIGNIHVHRWDRGLWWKIYSKAEYRKMKNGKLVVKLNRFFMRIKQIICIPIFPIYEPLLLIHYKKQAVKLFDLVNFDMVLAEYNGLDTLYAGWQLKRNRKVKFIPIFWDSLSGGFRPKYLPASFVDKRKARLEKKVLTDCDCAIVMQSHRDNIKKIYKNDPFIMEKIIFLDIPYLSICNQQPVSVYDKSKINIVFAGNMNMRDPTYFFKVVENIDVKNIVIHFYTKRMDHQRIRRIALDHNVTVELNDYVSHDTLKKFLNDADILLNFGVANPNAISGKVFEYIGYMKPIISTYFIDNEAVIPVLKKYPSALLIDERKKPEEYKFSITNLLLNQGKNKIDVGMIKREYRKNMPESYVLKLEEILKEGGNFE